MEHRKDIELRSQICLITCHKMCFSLLSRMASSAQ
jgi:hypothetical protein